jgi:hypothetical protein
LRLQEDDLAGKDTLPVKLNHEHDDMPCNSVPEKEVTRTSDK